MAILNMFGGAGGGVRIPLESPTTFTASPQDGKVVLTWTDPMDKVASPGGEMVAPWDYTIVVRKIGSYPQTPKDGVEVTRETTRNQYQTTGYADTLSIENDITYYYALFAVSTFGVWSEPATATAKPTGAHPQFYKSQFISLSGGNGVSAMEGSALASTTNHFIFAGGQNGSEYEDSSFYNVYSVYFDKNLTKGLLDNSNGKLRNAYLTPGRFNGHAVFVGGTRLQEDNDATEMIAYTPTLTKQSPWIDALFSDWLREPYAIGIASANDHIFYAGGQTENNDTGNSGVSVHDKNWTSLDTGVSAWNYLSFNSIYPSGTHVGDYALFFGGFTRQGGGANLPFAISDSTLTITEGLVNVYQTGSFATRNVEHMLGAASTGNYALFGSGTSGSSTAVTAYDESLTRMPQLSLGAAPVGGYTCGGEIGGFAMFAYTNSGNVVADCFNNTLTRINNVGTVSQLTQMSGYGLTTGSGVIDNIVMFGGTTNAGIGAYLFQYV